MIIYTRIYKTKIAPEQRTLSQPSMCDVSIDNIRTVKPGIYSLLTIQ